MKNDVSKRLIYMQTLYFRKQKAGQMKPAWDAANKLLKHWENARLARKTHLRVRIDPLANGFY